MKEGTQIRSGGIELIDAIEDLWEQLKVHHLGIDRVHPEGIRQAQFQKRKQELIKKGNSLLVELAQVSENSNVIGYCISTISENKIGELDSIFVEPSYRGLGIGKELVQRALNWMDRREVDAKRVNVLEVNEAAIALYRQFGFKTRQLEMVLPKSRTSPNIS